MPCFAGCQERARRLQDGHPDQEKKTLDLNSRLNTQQKEEITRSQAEITDVKGKLAVAQQTAKSTMEEVEAKCQQTNDLRKMLTESEKIGNEFKLGRPR